VWGLQINIIQKKSFFSKGMCGFVVLASCLLVACGSVPKTEINPELPTQWRNHAENESSEIKVAWWKALADPDLDAIVEMVLSNNLSIAQTYERLESERALEKAVLASQKPKLGIYLGPNSSVQFGNYRSSTAFLFGFDMTWELPYTSKNKGQRQVAKAKKEAAMVGIVGARSSIVAEAVRVYGEFRVASEKVVVTQRMLDYQEAMVKIVQKSTMVGALSEQDLVAAQSKLTDLIALHEDAKLYRDSVIERLDVLCGLNAPKPEWADLYEKPWQLNRTQVNAFAVPKSLIMARPDVKIAKLDVLQAAGNVGIAAADMYPKLEIEAAALYSGTLIEKSSSTVREGIITFLAPSVHFPIVDWGYAREIKNANEAELRRSILAYQEAVLQAIADTEVAIANFNSEDKKLQQSMTEYQQLNLAAERNQQGLKLGHFSPMEAFDSNIQLLERKLVDIDAKATWLAAYAAANKAQTDLERDKTQYLKNQE
jgi:outer membrane protein TolC